jgi:hypothetical protein
VIGGTLHDINDHTATRGMDDRAHDLPPYSLQGIPSEDSNGVDFSDVRSPT